MEIILFENNELLLASEEAEIILRKNLALYPKDLSFVRRLILVGDQDYQGAINLIDPKEGFTNSADFLGVGKTIAISDHESDVVVRAIVPALFIKQEGTYFDFPVETKFFAYTLFHEIGHCEDNSIRKSFSTSKPTIQRYKVVDFFRHCVKVLVQNEMAACFLSQKFVDEEVFPVMTKSFLEYKEQRLTEISNSKNSRDLEKTFESISVSFWLISSDLSKLVGYSFERKFDSMWITGDKTLDEAAQVLRNALRLYPNWNEEVFENLKDLFKKYALENGIKFVEGEDSIGDAIFW